MDLALAYFSNNSITIDITTNLLYKHNAPSQLCSLVAFCVLLIKYTNIYDISPPLCHQFHIHSSSSS
jgi:hypothetical protein